MTNDANAQPGVLPLVSHALGEATEDTKRRINRREFDTDDPDTLLVLERPTYARLESQRGNMT